MKNRLPRKLKKRLKKDTIFMYKYQIKQMSRAYSKLGISANEMSDGLNAFRELIFNSNIEIK